MKNKMEDIDRLIKETLSREEAKFYDELDEQNLLEMIGGLFKTKNRWLIVVMNIVNIVAFITLIYCIVQFLNTNTTDMLIKWFAAGFVCITFMIMIKLFSWMQMDKNALLREIKRLELQISSLSGKIPE
ncbi:hypothetical protein D1816_01690 [Aquimarina sp. AD10]|uniref:DUF6768 family protein n=1 Tax=Aquimarina sp. AD10 TaxID=1714849 RepID=UPI000E511472|nr:DUF6768 family protein [Aquimarina sp. AD10]AXT59112.1 hypothetical protein D1816_01690 [Aquimarina sp. AD10]RKM93100.1 hypothetical protein D7033_20115 [Aquimarina sp. AD10]